MPSGANIVVFAGLLIGLAYGVVGLLSGFCLMSGLRGWWVKGDDRLIRTYALALGVAVFTTQCLAAFGAVDLGKSVYLLPTFSAPLMFFGGVLFGYGMVLANGCGSRALVLLGRGNLRSFVVVIVLGIAAQMTIRGLIAPARVSLLQASQSKPAFLSLPTLLASYDSSEVLARTIVASLLAATLILFAFAHAPFRRAAGQIVAGIAVGLLGVGLRPAISAPMISIRPPSPRSLSSPRLPTPCNTRCSRPGSRSISASPWLPVFSPAVS